MLIKTLLRTFIPALIGCAVCANATSAQLSVEEMRLEKASANMPRVVSLFSDNISSLDGQWRQSKSYQQAKNIVASHAEQLWLDARKQINISDKMDDRPLYWARLAASKTIRTVKPGFNLTDQQLTNLLGLLEKGSRGRTDLEYKKSTHKKILLTGFDPLFIRYKYRPK